jgi:hypothetical protein
MSQVPLLFGAIDDGVGVEHARVVEQDVHLAKGPHRALHHLLALVGEADVTALKKRRSPRPGDVSHHLLAARLVPAGDDHPGALLGEEQGGGPADA